MATEVVVVVCVWEEEGGGVVWWWLWSLCGGCVGESRKVVGWGRGGEERRRECR